MKFNVTVKDGVATITDADTGKGLDWIDTVDLVLSPPAAPILYIGTTHFSTAVAVGPTSTSPGPTPPTP